MVLSDFATPKRGCGLGFEAEPVSKKKQLCIFCSVGPTYHTSPWMDVANLSIVPIANLETRVS